MGGMMARDPWAILITVLGAPFAKGDAWTLVDFGILGLRESREGKQHVLAKYSGVERSP